MNSTRCQIVFAALRSMGREVETSQWWQDVAFTLYDQAAHDERSPDAPTLVRWLQEYHLA